MRKSSRQKESDTKRSDAEGPKSEGRGDVSGNHSKKRMTYEGLEHGVERRDDKSTRGESSTNGVTTSSGAFCLLGKKTVTDAAW